MKIDSHLIICLSYALHFYRLLIQIVESIKAVSIYKAIFMANGCMNLEKLNVTELNIKKQ